MPYDIVNTKRSRSVIRVVGNTATQINLAALSTGADETITAAAITHVICSTDGKWNIYRGDNASGTLVLEIFDGCDLPLAQYDVTIANSSSSNIHVTNSGTGGSLILVVNKTAVYSTDLQF